jgi:hypothetical protein
MSHVITVGDLVLVVALGWLVVYGGSFLRDWLTHGKPDVSEAGPVLFVFIPPVVGITLWWAG